MFHLGDHNTRLSVAMISIKSRKQMSVLTSMITVGAQLERVVPMPTASVSPGDLTRLSNYQAPAQTYRIKNSASEAPRSVFNNSSMFERLEQCFSTVSVHRNDLGDLVNCSFGLGWGQKILYFKQAAGWYQCCRMEDNTLNSSRLEIKNEKGMQLEGVTLVLVVMIML